MGKNTVPLAIALAAAWDGVLRSFFQLEMAKSVVAGELCHLQSAPRSTLKQSKLIGIVKQREVRFHPKRAYSRLMISSPNVWKVEIISHAPLCAPASALHALSSRALLISKGHRRNVPRLITATADQMAILLVITRVLPEPAPASTRRGR